MIIIEKLSFIYSHHSKKLRQIFIDRRKRRERRRRRKRKRKRKIDIVIRNGSIHLQITTTTITTITTISPTFPPPSHRARHQNDCNDNCNNYRGKPLQKIKTNVMLISTTKRIYKRLFLSISSSKKT